MDGGAGEAALGVVGGAFHEEHDRAGGDGVLDCCAGFLGQEAGRREASKDIWSEELHIV